MTSRISGGDAIDVIVLARSWDIVLRVVDRYIAHRPSPSTQQNYYASLCLLISGYFSNDSTDSHSVVQRMTELRDLLQTVEAQANATFQATMSTNENDMPLHISANTQEANGAPANDSLIAEPELTSTIDASQIFSAAHPQTSGILKFGHAPAVQRTSSTPNVGAQPQVSEKPKLAGKLRSADLAAAAKPPTRKETVTIDSSESEEDFPPVSKTK